MNTFAMSVRAVRTFLLSCFAALALWGCGGGSAPTLQTIEISPLNKSQPVGTMQQYVAMAIFSDNTKTDVTARTTWSSSDATTASISSSGVATAVKQGTVTITGSFDGQSASTGLTIGAAVARSVSVTPASASLSKGSTRQYTATATFSDGVARDVTASATWTSSSTAVATVGNTAGSKGLVTAVSVGNSTIGASFQDISGSTALTVTAAALSSIQVTPSDSSLAKGTSRQFTATGVYTDNSTQNLTSTVTWTSADSTIATISNVAATKGVVNAVAVGATAISATQSGVVGSTNLTVTAATLTALQVTPATATRPKGAVQQFTATGTYSDQSTQDLTTTVVWSSESTAIATISNGTGTSGQATGVTEGSTTITAASGAVSGTAAFTVTAAVLARIEVTPSEPSIPVGTSQQFKATGVYTDNTTQDFTGTATWASSNTSVLEVSNGEGQRGLAVANTQGTATVTASAMDMTGSTVATVSAATLTSIQVTPSNRNLAKGFSLQYTATGSFSDNTTRDITTQVSWASSNVAAATISNADGSRGLATATATPGSTNISASSGSLTGITSLTVTNATLRSVAVTPANRTVPKGFSGNFVATGTFSDSSTQNLTEQASWSSSDTTKVTVSNAAGSKGSGVAVGVGSSTITASVSNAVATTAVNGTTMVTVSAATLTSIAVTPPSATAAKGTQQAFMANGTYSDNSTQDITGSVTWSSSNTAIATINNTSPNNGVATAVGTGMATITATSGSIAATASFEVTAAVLTSLDVTPKTPSIAAGRTQQFVATGTYSDGTMQTVTATVNWSSDTPAVATISNADGSRGLASSTTKGATKVKAASGTITSAEVTLTVTDAVPVSLAVTPASQTISNKSSLQYKATETFSDGSTSDQTAAVTWSSSNTAVADISNAADSKGLATTKTTGSVTITATDASVTPNITGSTPLTVGPATLQSISVTTVLASLPAGYKVQYKATGNYSDGSTQDLTTSVSWSTLNTAVATVSSDTGSKGVVTTVALGSTSVLASLNGVNGSAAVTVTSATLSSIAVTPANATITGTDTLQYTATASFSDGGKLDITTQVTWASSTTSAATIDQTGLATGGVSPFPGSSTISATRGTPAVTGQTTVSHTAF